MDYHISAFKPKTWLLIIFSSTNQDRIEEGDRRSRPPPRGPDPRDLPSLTGGGMSLGNHLGGGLGSGNLGLGNSSGPLANLLGLGNLNSAQGLNYRTDPLSCTVFVSNVSFDISLTNWVRGLHCKSWPEFFPLKFIAKARSMQGVNVSRQLGASNLQCWWWKQC